MQGSGIVYHATHPIMFYGAEIGTEWLIIFASTGIVYHYWHQLKDYSFVVHQIQVKYVRVLY